MTPTIENRATALTVRWWVIVVCVREMEGGREEGGK